MIPLVDPLAKACWKDQGGSRSEDSRRVPGQLQRPGLVPLVNIGLIGVPAGGRVSSGKGWREGWCSKKGRD